MIKLTISDIQRIFGSGDVIHLTSGSFVLVDAFLNIAGFASCEPTKEAMLKFDGGTKGYKELIESGNFTQQQ